MVEAGIPGRPGIREATAMVSDVIPGDRAVVAGRVHGTLRYGQRLLVKHHLLLGLRPLQAQQGVQVVALVADDHTVSTCANHATLQLLLGRSVGDGVHEDARGLRWCPVGSELRGALDALKDVLVPHEPIADLLASPVDLIQLVHVVLVSVKRLVVDILQAAV